MEEAREPLPDLLSFKEHDGSVESVVLSSTMNPKQQSDCYQLLEQFAPEFTLTPVITPLYVHDIDTGDSPSIKHKTYRLSDKVRGSIKQKVAKTLELRVIEPSSSP